jgi:uncharacterized protein with HEPN domain
MKRYLNAAFRIDHHVFTDSIPRNDIIGMRNKLSHGYFDVNLDIVWQTVKTDLPDLIKANWPNTNAV